jgi:hypothetical protein
MADPPAGRSPDPRDLERKSSAVTLSDMEVFIFPELMYSLVLANLMSPRIWKWREDAWFDGVEAMTPYRRITRLKQYIMDHYAFNLDLDTWGLTTKQREIARFQDYVSEEALAQSNALFGYGGDKYYFDIDIRTHFGLDKYEGDAIPYWKTETIEAMDAFRHKRAYDSGAGECVSLATLYAAALFIVARIPLSEIFLMATPLHSQDFVDTGHGVLTNNRRLVTKNERVTVVAHESGCIHILFPTATIDPAAYYRFAGKLRRFLQTPLTPVILGNFVRHSIDLQKCFQVRWRNFGVDRYIAMEKLLAYESSFPYRFNDDTRERLMMEVAGEDFESRPLPDRMILDDLERLVEEQRVDIRTAAGFELLVQRVASCCLVAKDTIERLRRFCWIDPRLPDAAGKTFKRDQPPLGLDVSMGRAEVVARLESLRHTNELAGLAFYAYRDLNRTEAEPFLEAALERCPVSIAACAEMSDEAVVAAVRALADESIYDGPGRLAQPDEVWNYRTGDGAEKALLLANILRSRHPTLPLTIVMTPQRATLTVGTPGDMGQAGDAAVLRRGAGSPAVHRFPSSKALHPQTWECAAP